MSDTIEQVRATAADLQDVAPDPSLAVASGPAGGGDKPPRTPSDDDPPPPDDPHDPIMRAAEQPLNDFGNGQRFVIHFGDDVLFVPRVGWFTWSGQVWEKDDDQLAVRARAQRIAALIEQETQHIRPTKKDVLLIAEERRLRKRRLDLVEIPEADRAENHQEEVGTIAARLRSIEALLKDHKSLIGRRLTHAKNAGNNGPLGHMLTESQTSLAVPYDALDAGPLDVNTATGLLRFSVLDLSDEGASKQAEMQILPHARDQRLSKMMPVDHDPEARSPMFDEFLARIHPDREMREFLKRWFGLSMTALTGDQKMAFFYGSGANGKSVLVDLMARILGNYSATARIETLTGNARRGGGDATPDLIPLMGARSVRTSEPDEGQRLQEGLIKELTGGEPLMVRALHSDFIEVKPIFKLTMSGNHKPEIRGTDDGIWRRVMLVPFDIQIPETERDPDLGKKLWIERSGVLNWLCEGLMDYLEGGLAPPENVIEATREFREESDPIGAFLTSCFVITGEFSDTILSKELGDAFNYHLMERGLSAWKPTTFAKQIAAKSRHWRHPETGRQFEKGKASISLYAGLKFTDAFGRRFRDAPRDHQGRPLGVASSHAPDPDNAEQRE